MKNGFKLAFGALLALGSALPANAIVIALEPSSQTVNVGDTTTIDLVVSGLGNGVAPSIGAYDLNVSFDPSILSFSGASFGNQLDLGVFGSLQFVDSTVAGTVSLEEVSLESASNLDTLQPGSFLLATLSFDAMAAGSSALNISVNALTDSTVNQLRADVAGATISSVGNVGAVPEPASLPLIGIGMLGMIALGMRRSRNITAR